jgi:flagellar biosynthetic protein FliR
VQTQFTYDAFLQWWGAFFWPFVRVGAFMAVMPVLSAKTIPNRFKLIISLILTATIAPSIQLDHPIDPFTNEGLFMAIEQVGIGLAMGLAFVVIFQAITIAGQMVANGMGLGFASLIDPSTGASSPVISQFYTIIISLFFVALDGHLLVIQMLHDSFVELPLNGHFLSTASIKALVYWGSNMFAWGVVVSLPAVTALLLANMALGLIGRAAPTLNVFSIGFVITILGGLLLLWWLLPLLLEQFNFFMKATFALVHQYQLTS